MSERLYDTIIISKGAIRGEERLFIRAPYKLRQVCQTLPSSFWDGKEKVWHVPFSPALVLSIEQAFTDCSIEGTPEWHELREEHERRIVAQGSKSADSLSDMPTTTTGWLHQRRAFHFARDLRAAALFVEMGGGKSAVAIGLCEEWKVSSVLIQCPKSVMGVWPKQFAEHAEREYDFWIGSVRGTAQTKAADLARFIIRPTKRPKVVIINYDTAWRSHMGAFLRSMQWDVEVLDESHKLKSPGGKASTFAKVIQPRCKRVLLLTGTPTPHGPGDIYAQYRAADPGIFGTSFNRHKLQYFETRKITEKVDKIVGFRDDRAQREFERKMGSIAIVIKKEDMKGSLAGEKWALPHVERQCMLDPGTWRKYTQLKTELVTEVDEGIVTADNVLVKGLRLRQATSGFLRTEDGIDSVVGTEKQQLLAEVLDEVPRGQPVVVFAVFHHDLDAIRVAVETIGARYGELSGRRRDGLTSDSTMAEDIDVLGCQLQSGGVGIDLTRSSYGIYYSIDYNLGNLDQSFARLDRPGQTRPVTFIHLVAVSPIGGLTVDGVTYKALTERKKLNEAVIDALRSGQL